MDGSEWIIPTSLKITPGKRGPIGVATRSAKDNLKDTISISRLIPCTDTICDKPPMTLQKMHANEALINAGQVKRLISSQFPVWQQLKLRPIPYTGTDNAIFRLGEEMVIRLPRIHWAAEQPESESQWLPLLAPHLPLSIPKPIRLGAPEFGYPWKWSIHQWLQGESALTMPVNNPGEAALSLALFVCAMRRFDYTRAAAAPPRGARGVSLQQRDSETRAAILSLTGIIDVQAATSAWEDALAAPPWNGPGVCLHGDLAPGNLLVSHGRLSAVIDFGELTIGDPACDLMVAWNYLGPSTRKIFRDALDLDDAAWHRGRGWALSVALIALPYYLESNPTIVSTSRRTISQVLSDHLRAS